VAIEGTSSSSFDASRNPPALAMALARRSMPAPTRLPIPISDWQTLVDTRANTVVVGQEEDALLVWTAVWPSLEKPIHWVDAEHLELPRRRPAGTLILQGADGLTSAGQQTLLDWLEHDARATRVLTTASRPLFPLVESGTFLEALYYRLNMILLVL
jgi:hypothetical protein